MAKQFKEVIKSRSRKVPKKRDSKRGRRKVGCLDILVKVEDLHTHARDTWLHFREEEEIQNANSCSTFCCSLLYISSLLPFSYHQLRNNIHTDTEANRQTRKAHSLITDKAVRVALKLDTDLSSGADKDDKHRGQNVTAHALKIHNFRENLKTVQRRM